MLARAAVVLAVAIPLVWFFGRAICTDEMFGYRDAAHYYYPYYWYVHEHWTHGIVPLWNPLENLGQPLAADPTAAAFYPGKVIFFLPFAYDWLYKVYIVGHVVLCAVTTYWLARQWQASRPAAGLAAVAYAFGGSVFFQYANVVFLVGAAWLPLAMWGAHRIVVKRDWWGVLGFAFATAMMVLGGDLEAAYLVSLAAILLAYLEWRRQATVGRAVSPSGGRAESDSSRPAESTDSGRANSPSYVALWPVLLAAAFALAFGLSAIQLIPSIVWGQKTERAIFDSPRSIYEIPSYLARPSEPEDPPLADDPPAEPTTWYGGLIGPPQPNTHDSDLYRYSVGPWRFVELLWPNFYGREFPENRRWGSVLPQEESPWTPSLYFGLIPLLLMLTQFAFWSGPIRSRWLTWTLLILTLGSLGSYGLVWLVREAIYLTTGKALDPPLNEAFGGVYWFFTVFLPGFVQFRYPAKLLVLATLCAAILAGRGLDRLLQGSGRRTVAALAFIVVIAGAHVVATVYLLPGISGSWFTSPYDVDNGSIFGPPIDGRGELLASVVHGSLSALILGVLCSIGWLLGDKLREPAVRAFFGMLFVVLAAMELCFAHAWSVVMVPASSFQIAGIVQDTSFQDGDPAEPKWNDIRIRRFTMIPRARLSGSDAQWPFYWRLTSSPGRLAEVVAAEMDALSPKYNLLFGVRVNSPGAARYAELAGFDHGFLWSQWQDAEVAGKPWPVWSFMMVLFRGSSYVNPVPPKWIALQRRSWFENAYSLRIGVPSRPLILARLMSSSANAINRRSRIADKSKDVIIEVDHSDRDFFGRRANSVSGRHASAQRIEDFIRVDQSAAGWLVFPEQYDPDFACEVTELATGEKSLTPIYRAQRVLRGIHLPAGKFEVRFLYRPWSFYLGAALSLLAWPLGLVVAWRLWRSAADSPTLAGQA